MCLFMLSAGLRCTDSNGCMLEHCLFSRLKSQYQNIVKDAVASYGNCRVKITWERLGIVYSTYW